MPIVISAAQPASQHRQHDDRIIIAGSTKSNPHWLDVKFLVPISGPEVE